MSIANLAKNTPVCPSCGALMAKRNSSRGQFWGCVEYPRCKGTRSIGIDVTSKAAQTTEFDAITQVPGSDEQEAIWHAILHNEQHVVVNAGPGTGKSFSMIQACLRLSKQLKVRFMAFNSHIDKELSGKLSASGCYHVTPSTFHSFGKSILKKHCPTLPKDADESKMMNILEDLSPEPLFGKSQWRKTLNLANKLSDLTKNYLIDHHLRGFESEMERLADHHGLEFSTTDPKSDKAFAAYGGNQTSQPANLQDALDLVPDALDICLDRASVSYDYNDMLWVPIVLNMSFDQYDIVISDESQDLNILQHQMILRACLAGRAVIVGDRHQSIYGFRGASTESMEILTSTLQKTKRRVIELPLTITRRCPKLHVQMAQSLFPDIRALDDAPMGDIQTIKADEAHFQMKPGDLVICRVNKHLITTAYKLMRRGIRPAIKGRDIGSGLMSLLETLLTSIKGSDPNSKTLTEVLMKYRYAQEGKLLPLGEKAQGRIEALHDKCDCLLEFITNSRSITEMKCNIGSMFDKDSDASNCVTLGTIHRTKGLEAERVFILAPELIPLPGVKKTWEVKQEMHGAWIAATRAKFNEKTGAPGTIIFCGPIPPIYMKRQYVIQSTVKAV